MSTSHFSYAAILLIHPSKIFWVFSILEARGQMLLIGHSGPLYLLDLKIISCVTTLRTLKITPFGFLSTNTMITCAMIVEVAP